MDSITAAYLHVAARFARYSFTTQESETVSGFSVPALPLRNPGEEEEGEGISELNNVGLFRVEQAAAADGDPCPTPLVRALTQGYPKTFI